MNKLSIIAGVLLSGVSVSLTAQAPSCASTERCQPPPCEFFEQIKMKQAVMRLFSRPKVRQQFIRQAGGDNAEAAKLMNDYVEKKAAELGKNLRCPWQAPFKPPPSFETNSSCEIIAKTTKDGEAMNRESALSKLDTCSEFIEAAYDHEQVHKDICFKTNSVERANEGITVYAAEERAGYTKELESLRASLQRFWNSCAAQSSSDTARKVAKAGNSVLKSKTLKSSATNAQPRPAKGS